MPTYDDLLTDLYAAFGADTFGFGFGRFEKAHEHDAGTFTRPKRFIHIWTVKVAPVTRDALIRRGLVERIPCLHKYRLSVAVVERVHAEREWVDAPSRLAFRAHLAKLGND